MSISPTDAHRSATSSSRAIPRSPSSDDGLREARDPLLRQIEAAGSGAAAPSPVPALATLADDPIGSSGSTLGVSRDSCDTSKNVIELRVSVGRKGPSSQKSGTSSQCPLTGRGGMSPQVRSDYFGPPQINGKASGPAYSVHSDHPALGSSGLQLNDAQSASRRNQVVNANHLLNFHYDPISRPQPRIPPPRRQQKIKPYNRDLFLQANYKFVVLDTNNYQLESMDPDKMLQWEDIVCVRYSTPMPVHCPICLESPFCSQITSCGHIYCFPCILRYLLMGEEDRKGECWKKCPLCFMMISAKDLYTIHIDNVKQFQVGDHAYFTLLTRSKHSVFPLLKNPMPYSSDGIRDSSFSKFIMTSDVELSVREAKLDLNNWIYKAESDLVDDLEKLPYVYASLEHLDERIKNWMARRVSSGSPPQGNGVLPSDNHQVAHTLNKTQTSALNFTSNAESSDSDAWEPESGTLGTSLKHEITDFCESMGAQSSQFPLAAVPESYESAEKVASSNEEGKVLRGNTNICKDARERDSYTFYQAVDGQHLILHPLNMKCLLHHYSTYEMLPQGISGEILEMETVTQSEAMRRRYRFLSHFSLTTTFQLCEIDLSESLPPSSLAPFMDEIKKREKQRKRLARKEQDERERAEAAALPDIPMPPGQNHSSHRDAIFSLDDFTALGGSGAPPSTSPPITSERRLFSSVTRLGFAAAHDSPAFKPVESADSLRNVVKTAETSTNQGPRAMTTLSFANIISAAAAAKTAESPETQGGNVSGKKGKKPTKVLLSTSGGRRY